MFVYIWAYLHKKNLKRVAFPFSTSNCSEGPVWKEGQGDSLAVHYLGLKVLTAKGKGSIPGRGSKIPQAGWHGQKKKRTKRPQKEGKESVQVIPLWFRLRQWQSHSPGDSICFFPALAWALGHGFGWVASECAPGGRKGSRRGPFLQFSFHIHSK